MQPHIVGPTGHARPMTRIRCKDEIHELQDLLHLNPHLLPGDQINPADPRRWLLIKREMPVPNAATGIDFYNIDFLYVDQSAMPTFVECKRYRDTRARREVVGQMMEYAANGAMRRD
jgi:hypothetical protein